MVRRRWATLVLCVPMLSACGSGGITSSSSISPSADPSTPAATAASASPAATASAEADLQLVAVGDSIPYNSPDDCPGCTAFVDRYADTVATATGQTVGVRNLSEHNNLQVDGLLRELESDASRIEALKGADVIIVGIAHNDVPMNRDDDSCDGPFSENPDWSKYTDECIAEEVAKFTPKYESVYEQIAALRAGKPTILRTINRYNDWVGWPGHDLSAEGVAATAAVVDAWNRMICTTAEANGFLCADISVRFNGESGTEPAGEHLAGDYTHPSDKGNEVIAQALADLGFAPLAP